MTQQRTRDELEFLPATLEIQDTPPSPIGRAITWSIMILFGVAIAWACIGEIEIVAVAQGKVIPSDRVKIIQPLEIGTIRAIHVEEGQQVAVGDLLIEMDTTASGADQARVGNELAAARLEVARLKALEKRVKNDDARLAVLRGVEGADAQTLALHQRLLQQEWDEYAARLAAADSMIASRRGELATSEGQLEKYQATLPLVTQRTEALRVLMAKQLAPQQQYLELEQQRVETAKNLESEQQHVVQLQAAVTEATQTKSALQAEFLRTVLQRLNEAERNVAALSQDLAKADQRHELQRLVAPTAGVVQQLAVHTIGGVVTPAQELLHIVPLDDHLEVEAFVANKDIGFVGEQQTAAVKLETFPFTKYGTLDGTVRKVSYDAVSDEKLGLVYSARIALGKAVMRVNDKWVNLTPGMAVTVEIKTGTRRLIEYVLSPLAQYVDESARER